MNDDPSTPVAAPPPDAVSDAPATAPTEVEPLVNDEHAGPSLRLEVGGLPRWRTVLWAAITLGALSLLVGLAVAAPSVSIPLLVAFIIAYLLDPVVDRFEARGVSRSWAIVILLGACFLVLTGLAVLVIPQVVSELGQLPAKLKLALERLLPWIEQTAGIEVPLTAPAILHELQQDLAGLDMAAVSKSALGLAKGAYGGTMGVLAVLAGAVIVPLFAFYLLRDFDHIVADARGLIPVRFRAPIAARFAEIDTAMSSFMRGQITVAGILAVLYSVGLWAAGLPLALVVGVLAGLGNMIPYLGTAVGLSMALLLSLLSGEGWPIFAKVGAVFVVAQGIEGWVLTPKVVGESVGLSPFMVILSVLFFGELFGFVGVLIAVPLAAILKILLRVGIASYRASHFFAGD